MKLLVTGGAGFIGSNFIRYWVKYHPKDKIVNLDVLTYAGNLENLTEIETLPSYRFVKGDILDAKIVHEVMKGTDVIVHFAAESHVDRSILGPAVFLKTNVLGTHVLLDAALKAKVKRFHHVSTDEVFGTLPLSSTQKFHEDTLYQPRSPYAASKAGSDHIVRAYHVTYGLPITITNCSNNFGPYQFPEKFIPLAITNLLEGKKIPVYGNGKQVRDWLYVDDHCRAIERVLLEGKVGETYLVGGQQKEEVRNIDVAREILRLLGKSEEMIEYVKDRPGHDVKYAIDWTKIREDLRWKPQYEFREWLEKTVSWYNTHTKWWKRVKSGAYKTYYKMQYGKRRMS
ncbi:MAG TPA: dTDP-glucose 4,6-dehydratase [Patescibacteria group bacterium]|nr:dTDP-glucose 4,6-dehydratase [Patescibacteria group bacterium]